MNLLDRAIAAISPLRGLRRAQARAVLASYEAARPGPNRKIKRDGSTGERAVIRDAASCRAQARDMERNHDLVSGALDTLVRNVVGPTGISIEPQPRTPDDDIHDDFARELLNWHREWSERPEVTGTMDRAVMEHLACRTWMRDGEVLAQVVEGYNSIVRDLPVPIAFELMEPDLCPLDYASDDPLIEGGVEKNAWGRPVAFHLYKVHPGGHGLLPLPGAADMKRVPAERMLHLALRRRLHQVRGISVLASVIVRLEDVKDYEDSERIAARIAAAIAAYVKRDKDMDWTPPGDLSDRRIRLESGSVFEDLLPGEDLAMLNPNRPNTALAQFREGQLRAAAAGLGTSYSSLARDYNGTYSAQRQELVETWSGYRALTTAFVNGFTRPMWRRFVATLIASGRLRVPRDVRPETIAQADFRGPAMPWIDPLKEASAGRLLIRGGMSSLQAWLAERGMRMQDVLEQLARERKLADELGLVLESDARTRGTPPGSSNPDTDSSQEGHGGASDEDAAEARRRRRSLATGEIA